MTDNTDQQARLAALAQRGKAKLGDQLFERVVQGTRRACAANGVSEESVVQTAIGRPDGFELLESFGVDQISREASAGDKEAAKTYDEWYLHSFPNSRKARWARGER